ncbi:DUF6978 family protein [Bacillus paranthracis]|uniref:DUF6978 family protein n=1 Tax=Bacillus paranthracis TaxID=2026186 RepID=UPI0029C5B3FB|nr:hypothetical protein [Bacillus paranthracis]MDX6047475.1 hypothetical protein [Bacillus paranthracis]
MKQLQLTDTEAQYFIEILKLVLKKYQIDLKPGNQGSLLLKSHDNRNQFVLDYFTAKLRNDKMSLHLREKETNISLARVNIDPTGFHKNADKETIKGHRILIFSSEEFLAKNDGTTYVKAHPLPDSFSDTNDLEQVFLDFLGYTNVKQEGKIELAGLI